ncbi:hypothetical protein PROFUN_04782 [Planoprotostelium fungivorum]|uniref:Cyclase family protein n=1 Tax=Planoprotostelium fungivorum TaxID=1890364 RepID=A0A2P6NSX2_9EUKA|nr:hypothetical protein PROFUN_04782 [Planoprotostelium fungivorum]
MQQDHFTFRHSNKEYVVDTQQPIDLSLPVNSNEDQLSAFYLPSATFKAFEAGSYIGDVRRGGSTNCEEVKFCPHGNGTHTECVGHITKRRIAVDQVIRGRCSLVPALLITVSPETISSSGDEYGAAHSDDDKVISSRSVRAAFEQTIVDGFIPRAIVIRTTPNGEPKRTGKYSGNNPPYLTPATAQYLSKDLNVEHLLLDLPR